MWPRRPRSEGPTPPLLVSAPKWVGWIKLDRGWEAAYSHDDRDEVRRLLLDRYGVEVPSCVLRMGERPAPIVVRRR